MQIKLDGQLAIVGFGEKFKPALCKLSAKGNSLVATLQNEFSGTAPDEANIESHQILCLLPNPDLRAGSAYGVSVQPWYRVEKVKDWGIINYFRDVSDTEQKVIDYALSKVKIRLLDKYKLKSLILPLAIHIRPKKGSMDGSYKVRPDASDVITLQPKEWEREKTVHLLAHECAHNFWTYYLSSKQKAAWVTWYKDGSTQEPIPIQALESARADWIKSGTPIKDYRRQLEEVPQQVFDSCIGWVQDTYFIKPEFADILRENGETFKNMWPKTQFHLADIEGRVTTYSSKNPEELFCECVGLLTAKTEMPDKAKDMVIKSLKSIRPR